ncbi:MAG: cobalamin-dependent protein, partial [Elusimicrobiota bacterium]|nr:cobalamin-dependent protein [Elusimicrobiota bacterium]
RLEALCADALARASCGPAYPAFAPGAPAVVLLFRCLLEAAGKEGADRLNQGTFYLASALRAAGARVVLSDAKISRFTSDPREREALARLLADHPDITMVALSLYDAYFEEAAALVSFLRERTEARIAIGALMPTRDPEPALAHLPGVDFAGRGAGEALLPRLAALAGPFDEAARGELLGLDGVLAVDGDSAVWAGAEDILRVPDLDACALDFSFLERRDAESGPAFCLSRGCGSACRFCTSPDQGRFHGKTASEVGKVLAGYGRRLKELYGSWSAAPAEAFGIGFYDDDFLADAPRARAVLDVVRRSPFHLRFVQASIRAFFRDGALDEGLLDALDPALFAPKLGRGEPSRDPQLYLGTESFCGAELERLGKGYGTAEVSDVVRALSRRGLRQAHHFIATNARTCPGDVLESLGRIVRLRAECGPEFALLEPVIAHLISFPGTPILRTLRREGLDACVELRGTLSVPGFPEFDYPLTVRDAPADADVAAWAERLALKGAGVDWEGEYEGLLFEWLLLSERLSAAGAEPARAARLRRAVDAQSALMGAAA